MHSAISRASSSSHSTSWRSELVRPWPTYSSPRAFIRSTISGHCSEHGRIDVVRAGQAELVEQVEIVPDPDPVAVIAPGVVALALRRRAPVESLPSPAPKAKNSMLLQKKTASRLPSGQSY